MHRRLSSWLAVVLVGLISGGIGAGIVGGTAKPLGAASAAPAAGEIIALTSDTSAGAHLIYLIDARQKSICVYEYENKKQPKFRLAAVRHYATDQELAEYNNDTPHVAEIEKLVRQR